jgi:FkbM family methyltransferase
MKVWLKGMLARFGYEIRRKGAGPPDPFAVQRRLIKSEKPVIFDVGAYTGAVARKYRELFPLASVYCFEPFPQSCELLRQNTARDARTTVYEVAMSDRKDKDILKANTSPSTNSLLSTDKEGSFYWGKGLLETTDEIEVDTTSIDCFCRESGIPAIDILKIDVQGAEFRVLTGGKDMLSSQSISLIYSEIILTPTYQRQHKLHEYFSLLDSLGYELLDLCNPVRKRERLAQADLIFQSRKFGQQRGETLVP